MKTSVKGSGQRVWVSSVPVDWPQSVAVQDAEGRTHTLAARGPYCIFDDTAGRGQLGIGAGWVAELAPGRHLVRFADGTELTVALDSPYQWDSGRVAA